MNEEASSLAVLTRLQELARSMRLGYSIIATYGQSSAVKVLCQHRELKQLSFQRSLDSYIHKNISLSQSHVATLDNCWSFDHEALGEMDQLDVLAMCEQAESQARGVYESVLNYPLPESAQHLLVQQLLESFEAHYRIKTLRERL